MDAALVLALHGWAASQPWLTALAIAVAQGGIFLLPLALVALWLAPGGGMRRRRHAVVAACLAAVLAATLGLVLEHTLDRPRPFTVLSISPLFPHAADSSFPSDHTLVGAALVGPFLWASPRVAVGLVLWTVVVGAMRVAAGVHYPSDIAGSVIVGLMLDLVCVLVLPRLMPIVEGAIGRPLPL